MAGFKSIGEVLHSLIDRVMWHDEYEKREAHSAVSNAEANGTEVTVSEDSVVPAGQVKSDQLANKRATRRTPRKTTDSND